MLFILIYHESKRTFSLNKRNRDFLKKCYFQLIEGDEITISGRPNLVKIKGAINSPGNFQFFPKTRLDEYIKLAGGLTTDASRQAIFIEYPNGTSKKISMFNFSPRVMDGSIITIGKKEESEPLDKTELAKEIASIVSDFLQIILTFTLLLNSST